MIGEAAISAVGPAAANAIFAAIAVRIRILPIVPLTAKEAIKAKASAEYAPDREAALSIAHDREHSSQIFEAIMARFDAIPGAWRTSSI